MLHTYNKHELYNLLCVHSVKHCQTYVNETCNELVINEVIKLENYCKDATEKYGRYGQALNARQLGRRMSCAPAIRRTSDFLRPSVQNSVITSTP